MRGRLGRRHLVIAAAVVVALAAPVAAHAATGYVSGSAQLWNGNGNYCPTTSISCAGSRYPQSQFHTWQPLSNVFVNVYDAAGTFIGQGGTGTDGTFSVSWTAPVTPSQIRLRFYAWQKEQRFFFTEPAGGAYNWFTNLITPIPSTVFNPQAIGGVFLGSSAAPDPYANAYWAAEREWREVFNLVGVLQTNFTGVEIRGFADDIPGFQGSCPTSCAVGESKQVQLDSGAGFSPQGRVTHELGHIASYVTHAWKRTRNYNWPNTTGNSGWSRATPEWSDAAFEEAMATHYGSVLFWGDDATVPTTCLSALHCYSGTGWPASNTDIEATSFPFSLNSCNVTDTNPESRWPISHMRFLWDVYDSRVDADGDTYSAAQGQFWMHLHNLAWYPEGTEANQIDEPWNADRTTATELDGRGMISYVTNYAAHVNVNLALLRVDNCSPQ